MDVPKQGANICGYTDFPGDIIKLYEKLGFDMLPRIAIWKEPLSVRLRTMSKALAHRTICEDSTLTNVAASDYLIPFRKHGANPVPVAHPVGLTEYYGEREVPSDLMRYRGYEGKQTENRYSQWVWRHYASSMWDDIRLGEVLRYDEAKDEDDERHQHPLQLDVIYRAVTMWSNPGETVLTPFMGVGSEVYGAVKLGRRGIGCELKPSYYRQAVKNLHNIDDTPQDDQLDLLAMADDVHSDDFS
jgi:DNA modification methylase